METVELLPKEEICFVKKINLENNYFSGVVCYTRKLSENYRMNPHVGKNNYQEDEYPSDSLDKVILQVIQEIYPNAICRTEIQMFSDRLEQNRRWLEQCNKSMVTLHIIEDTEAMLPCSAAPVTYPNRCFEVQIYKYNLNPNTQSEYDFFTCHVETTEYEELKRLKSSLGQLE